jgi:hypothetical protein
MVVGLAFAAMTNKSHENDKTINAIEMSSLGQYVWSLGLMFACVAIFMMVSTKEMSSNL